MLRLNHRAPLSRLADYRLSIIMNSFFNIGNNNKAQTAIELAIFGAILIFVIGLIVRTGLNNAYQQNQQLRAMRMAMKLSYENSEGLIGSSGGDWSGNASRNSASVTIVEDRLTASSDKTGAIDRIPWILSGSATFTRNLNMPVDAGEDWNLPMMDIIINGQQFPLAVAGFSSPISVADAACNVRDFPVKIPNSPELRTAGSRLFYNPNCADCFNLDQAGGLCTVDSSGNPMGTSAIEVPAAERDVFAWQWGKLKGDSLQVGDSVDVDCDLKEERVINVFPEKGPVQTITVMDFQKGDLDTTYDSNDKAKDKALGRTGPGLTNDMALYTQVGDGTYLLLEENGVRKISMQKKQSVDLVERILQLSYNTGRFCDGNVRLPTVKGTDIPNPVEICHPDCRSALAAARTCYDTDADPPRIYIRSRIRDIHGRKWITDFGGDKSINFKVPGF